MFVLEASLWYRNKRARVIIIGCSPSINLLGEYISTGEPVVPLWPVDQLHPPVWLADQVLDRKAKPKVATYP